MGPGVSPYSPRLNFLGAPDELCLSAGTQRAEGKKSKNVKFASCPKGCGEVLTLPYVADAPKKEGFQPAQMHQSRESRCADSACMCPQMETMPLHELVRSLMVSLLVTALILLWGSPAAAVLPPYDDGPHHCTPDTAAACVIDTYVGSEVLTRSCSRFPLSISLSFSSSPSLPFLLQQLVWPSDFGCCPRPAGAVVSGLMLPPTTRQWALQLLYYGSVAPPLSMATDAARGPRRNEARNSLHLLLAVHVGQRKAVLGLALSCLQRGNELGAEAYKERSLSIL